MKAGSKAGWARLAIPGLLAVLAAAIFLTVASRIDVALGLSARKGSIMGYASPGAGIYISLQRSGKDAWGFFEWPDRLLYGFFSGTASKDEEIRAEIRIPGKSRPRLILSKPRLNGSAGLRLEGLAESSGNYNLVRSGLPALGLRSFQGLADAERRSIFQAGRILKPLSVTDGAANPGLPFFHIDAFVGISPEEEDLLDRELRLGRDTLAYARYRWEGVRNDRGRAGTTARWSPVFVERHFLIPSGTDLYSVAAERYVFSGGAHGNTTTLFHIVDAGKGKVLGSGDLFIEGWEEALEGKLRDEALRLLSGSAERRGDSLVAHGFFEERIFPSESIFICRSGVGFHYDRYRLAPYAEGDFAFVVPWKELDGLLNVPGPWGESR